MLSSLKKKRHLAMAWFWLLAAVPIMIWFRDSIMVVLIMSLYANIEASLAAHNAADEVEEAIEDDRL